MAVVSTMGFLAVLVAYYGCSMFCLAGISAGTVAMRWLLNCDGNVPAARMEYRCDAGW